jgi:transcriptional regulator with GAF, ATPase, and Fis domain
MLHAVPARLGGSQGLARVAGVGPWARTLRADLIRVACLSSTVLVTGETGTGKGQVARALHEESDRRDRPFVHVDCAALSPTLIESELFGHEKGAFTSALERHVGRFELACDGTLFLDEVGDLDAPLQAKLLRALEDREFERVGGQRTLRLRARVIAATSRDLRQAVAQHGFRADLYFRLNVFRLQLPPLRERLEDLPVLVALGLHRSAERLGLPAPEPTPELLRRLETYTWPGNVRELMNVLERVVVCADGRPADASTLDGAFEEGCIDPTPERDPHDPGLAPLHTRLAALDALEREQIVEALAWSGGNIAAAARRLRIPRGTLRHRMARHGLELE